MAGKAEAEEASLEKLKQKSHRWKSSSRRGIAGKSRHTVTTCFHVFHSSQKNFLSL
jgi:hypothetical protein